VLKWFSKVTQVLSRRPRIDEALWEELEEALIGADVSAGVALRIVDDLRSRARAERWADSDDIARGFREEVERLLADDNPGLAEPPERPALYLLVGVNGTGKTTSAAKLAWDLKQQGKSVLLAAADTFRAAAIDQLQIWAERTGVDMVKHQPNADPSAVVFDAVAAAKARGADAVIADTAGRLHNKQNLMQELAKLGRVSQKALGRAPDETLLVVDATTGQNAISQAREFGAVTPLTGVILTKMEGTAKGGVVLTLAEEMKLPVKFIGLGEKIADLQPFDARAYAAAIFGVPEPELPEEEAPTPEAEPEAASEDSRGWRRFLRMRR
jgi:fused signal recognition particle receptor